MYQLHRRIQTGVLQSGPGFIASAGGGGGAGSWSLISHISKNNEGANVVTTADAIPASIDTTGADLLVAVVGFRNVIDVVVGDLTDSKGNTWTMLTQSHNGNNDVYCVIFYSKPTTVGSGHTFTFTHTSSFPSICVAAFSGSAASPFDQQNTNVATAATCATGSITPSQNNELVIAGSGARNDGLSTPTIDSGFTITDVNPYIGGAAPSMAYKTQTTAAAVNPTWTAADATTDWAASIASFKSA